MAKRQRPKKTAPSVLSLGTDIGGGDVDGAPPTNSQPTEELTSLILESLVVGLTVRETAIKFKIDEQLVKQLEEQSKIERKYQISILQWQAAKYGSEAMLKLLGREWLGQDDTQRIELFGAPPGGELTREQLLSEMKKMIEDNTNE